MPKLNLQSRYIIITSNMFEAHVFYLMQQYFGEYIEGLSVDSLRISLWKGIVVFKDLRLTAEALSSWNLPVTIKAGFIGTIRSQVSWKCLLGKEPASLLIDRLFVIAERAPDGHTLKDEDIEKLFESRLTRFEELVGRLWARYSMATIYGDLKFTITNASIIYEDSISDASSLAASRDTSHCPLISPFRIALCILFLLFSACFYFTRVRV